MILLRLFFTFFVIGLVSFGGGYGMIPLIEDTVRTNGWLTEQAFVSLIAVSESTPGPLAVNMATYIGSTVGGFIGALAATIGVVLPSFCIITAIAMLSGKLLRNARVGMVASAFLSGVRPCVVGMILSTAITMSLGTFVGFGNGALCPDWRAMLVFLLLIACDMTSRRIKKRPLAPILAIALSACLGMVMF